MWKWIGGIILLILVLVFAGMCYGFRKIQGYASGPGETTTLIGATPARVFASLADGDSIPDWMVMGTVRPSRHGILRVGDSLTVIERDTADPRMQRMKWVVSEVSPGKLFAVQMRNDSLGIVMVVRRFALEARGDSTALTTAVTSPVVDSASAEAKTETGTARAMMGLTVKLMLGAMRMQSQMEVNQLKARVEGRPTADVPRP